MHNEPITFDSLLDDTSFWGYALNRNPQDVRKWENWRNHHPVDIEVMDNAARTILLLHSSPSLGSLYSKEDEFEKLLGKINRGVITKTPKGIFLSQGLITRIAAAILLLIGIGLAFKLIVNKINGPEIASAFENVFVPRGERKTLVLSDGTKVWINSDSKLRYPAEFKGNHRTVYLEGEAYFDVAHDKRKPFSVITSEIRVNVIGTAFNVKSYPEDISIETTLERGIINIQRVNDYSIEGKKEIFLKPNQKYVFLKSQTNITVEQNTNSELTARHNVEPIQGLKPGIETVAETEIFTGWRDNKLSFKNERLADVKKKMERWYNIKIGIQNPELRNKRLSGTFVNETLNEALKALHLASDINYTIKKDSVIIQ